MQAKAKRLARFRVELTKTLPNNPDIVEQGVSTEMAMDGTDGNALLEYEGVELSGVIIGLCPDMCPGVPLNQDTKC